MGISYLDGRRLRRALLAGCDHVEAQRRELNRINVFPVPDGDTGTNLALTVRAIRDHLRDVKDSAVSAVAREAAEAALLGARGNSGMMLSHFLLGFADQVKDHDRLDTPGFSHALGAGVSGLYEAVDEPMEGTILTVIRETAEAARDETEADFVSLMERLLARARESLARTPDLLPVLKEAGVVDAGAKGFVHLLEGVASFVARGDPAAARRMGAEPEPSPAPVQPDAPPVAAASHERRERFAFCTEALVRGEGLPSAEELRSRLRPLGDSLVVVRSGAVAKVHIHTDEPDRVFEILEAVGTLATHKAEDMGAQQDAIARAGGHLDLARRPICVVTESAHDLPEEVIRAHGIKVVPLLLLEGDRVLRDGVDISAEEFHARMGRGDELPTTSQPAPADFLRVYRQAAEEGEELLYVGLSSALSGTFASGEAAAGRFQKEEGAVPVHLFDSRAASILQGLLVLKGVELAEQGLAPAEIRSRLERIRDRSGLLFTVDTFDRLQASGRVGWGRAWFGRLLRVKPILGLSADGRIEPVGKAMGRSRVLPEVMELLARRISPGTPGVRFGVVHVGCAEVVERVRDELRKRYGKVEILDGPATAVLATHLGPGAWGIAYLREGEGEG
jgi:uncharacterized protein